MAAGGDWLGQACATLLLGELQGRRQECFSRQNYGVDDLQHPRGSPPPPQTFRAPRHHCITFCSCSRAAPSHPHPARLAVRSPSSRKQLYHCVGDIVVNFDNRKTTSVGVNLFDVLCAGFFCKNSFGVSVIQEIQRRQISYTVGCAETLYIPKVAATQHVVMLPAIDHTGAFASSQGALQLEIFLLVLGLRCECFGFYMVGEEVQV